MQRPRGYSFGLRAKVLFLLAAIFLLVAGQAAFKAVLNFDQLTADKKNEFQWIARWIASEQHRHLAQARQVAFLAMNRLRKGLDRHDCLQGVRGAPGLDPEFGAFAIADPRGNIRCNSIPWLKAANVADQTYFKQALQHIDLGYIEKVTHESGPRYAAVMARAMRDNGHVQQVILVGMDFSWAEEEIKMAGLPKSAHLLLVDANGTVINGTSNVSALFDRNISDTPYFRQAAAASDRAYEGVGFGGAESIVVAQQVATGSGAMRVLIDIPRDVLLQPAWRNLITMLAMSSILLVALMGLLYFLIDRYFLKKINAIEHAADALATGDMGARTGLTGKHELDHLARAFDAMADALQIEREKLAEANDELFRVNRALRVLSAGNRSLLFATSEEELLVRVCHDIVVEGGYLAAWIGFSEARHDEYLRTAAAYSSAADEAERIDWNKAGNGLKPVITAVREGSVLVINDTGHESVHRHLGEQAARFGYRSVVVLPLHLEGTPIGALILTAHRENEFGETQVAYLKETASDISFGIEMLRTRGERNRLAVLEEHHEKMLRESLEDALSAIALTIEMRDPYTSGHQKRVAELAKSLAIELGMDADEAHGIYLASIVHDIGKVNVPAEVLVKPGKLNDIEYALVKTHVESSYRILQGIKFPWPIAEMAHQHHERLDGSGYPLGLKDGEISFGGRIMAVADVVEAMASHRPYRPGLGIDVALTEIEKGRGTVYDAAVVDACLRLFRERGFRFA